MSKSALKRAPALPKASRAAPRAGAGLAERKAVANGLRFAGSPALWRGGLLRWYQQVARPLPWRTLWQAHRDPYHIWVSEIMLQQTVIKAVLPVYARFLERFPTVQDLAAADEDSVRQAVRGLGYYRRFRFLHRAAQQLVVQGGTWPTTFAGWKELPGIGDYTAAAISSIAFGYPAAVVDGNVERVFCRLLDLRQPPNEPALKRVFQRLAGELLDHANPGDFNQAVMELGQTVCTVSAPACGVCPLSLGCLARERGSQALAPAPKTKTSATDVAMTLVVLRRGTKVAVFERAATAKFLKGTAGFLTAVTAPAASPVQDGCTRVLDLAGAVRCGQIKHGITHHRIVAQVLVIDQPVAALVVGARWVEQEALEEQLVSNLDRKAWHLVLAAATPLAGASSLAGLAGNGTPAARVKKPRLRSSLAPLLPQSPR